MPEFMNKTTMVPALAALLAIAAIVASAVTIARMSHGLTVEHLRIGNIPATVYRPSSAGAAPTIVIAHGFAGSQQLMQPLATTLARNGYVAVTFDFAGHGRNRIALDGGIVDMARSTQQLLGEIGEVVAVARALPNVEPRLALVGHSMAAELVVQYAMTHDDVAATVALSLFGRAVTATSPRNLLVIDGAWEPSVLTDAGLRTAALAGGADAQPGVTYGDMTIGTARRFALAQGAEHIGVIYSRDALLETTAWMNAVFGRTSDGFYDTRGKWLALLFAGLILLAWPLTQLLPRVAPPTGAGLRWRVLLPVAITPALLTPLILWKAPTDFLPILLGDYFAVHFVVYGALTALGLWLTQRGAARTVPRIRLAPFLASVVAIAVFYLVALGLPIDLYITSFMSTPPRWPLVAAMFCATAIYFLADEWLTRGPGAARGAYAFTKLCFALSLLLAVALNPMRLFFLLIIVPVICILFVVYGLVSRWTWTRIGDPRVAALATALALAWAIAVTFPVVG